MNTDELFIDGHKLPKPLKKEETYDLIDKMKQGDASAIKKLIEHNIRLVLYEVRSKFKYIKYDKKDLVSVGNIGLMKSINTFDTSKKVEFSTYAIRCIDNEILMFLRKNKKYQNVDSLNRTINYYKNGNELNVEDTLSDDVDIVKECTDNETYHIIRRIVSELPERNRDIIIMYFGFFNNRRYTQKEIAEKFKITQPYVSRLIDKIVQKLSYKLEAQGVIELREKPEKNSKKCSLKTKKEGGKEMARELQTIYEYFNQYTKEQIDEMLSKLTVEERNLVTLRYGEDLEHAQVSDQWSKDNANKFYGNLIPKMKRLLSNSNNEKKLEVENKNNKKGTQKKENTPAVVINSSSDEMIKEDYLKILELLKTPNLSQMLNMYSPKEAMIIYLKLGHIDGKCFSTSSIASFLDIDSQEVINTTKTILLSYKERLNQMIDCAIKIATEEPTVTDETHNKSLY